jgi:hypothetical protein
MFRHRRRHHRARPRNHQPRAFVGRVSRRHDLRLGVRFGGSFGMSMHCPVVKLQPWAGGLFIAAEEGTPRCGQWFWTTPTLPLPCIGRREPHRAATPRADRNRAQALMTASGDPVLPHRPLHWVLGPTRVIGSFSFCARRRLH